MAHVQNKTIKWDNPIVDDVVKHQVFIAPEGEVLDMSSIMSEIPMPTCHVIAPDGFPLGTFDNDKINYQIGIVSFDDQGNYSDMAVLTSYPFDFVPPPTPVGGIVI